MNKVEISKELLSEVLNEKVEVVDIKTSIDDYTIPTNEIRYYPALSTGYKSINIYELAFKNLKQWAISKGYQIISGLSDEPAYRKQDERTYAKLLWYEGDDIHREYKDMYFMANTEVEAVIKASEYVLKEINENR